LDISKVSVAPLDSPKHMSEGKKENKVVKTNIKKSKK